MQTTKLAMIGCGRAAESLHLPSAALGTGVETTVLVDTNIERAARLAKAYGVAEIRQSVAEAAELAEVAVVALPHHLHAPITRELLEAGLHVLVEKPLALDAEECSDLAKLARERGLTLAVGMIRRRFPTARFVKRALERDLLGSIEQVTVREGGAFSWEVASDFTFRRDTGGGVLADTGAHVLDLLGWWFGEPQVNGYRDDATGGVEAECEIDLTLANGAAATVELSRLRQLENEITILGSRGSLQAPTGFAGEMRLDLGDEPLVGNVQPVAGNYHNVREIFIEQLNDFVRSVNSRATEFVSGEDACLGVKLLEDCRARRDPLRLPWREIKRGVAA